MNRAGVMVSGTAAHSTLVTENVVPVNTMVTDVVADVEPQQVEAVEEVVETVSEPETVAPTRFYSGEGFDVELPPDVLFRIRTSLRDATYDGYNPIVKWDQHGRVILDFEPLND
jgi:hypothetical protein